MRFVRFWAIAAVVVVVVLIFTFGVIGPLAVWGN